MPTFNRRAVVRLGGMSLPAIDSVVYAREIPGAQLATYPDSGHGFLFQYPERFADDIRDFLDTL